MAFTVLHTEDGSVKAQGLDDSGVATTLKMDDYGSLQATLDGVMQDAFGNLRVSTPHTIFDSKQIADKQPLIWDDQLISGSGGASTYNANQASTTLSVDANTAAVRARQTFRRFNYQPGKSQKFLATGVLGTPATGITRRIGEFDANNGIYFESGPTAVAVGIRTKTSGSVVDNKVLQTAWNIDRLDGTGPSKAIADWSKTHIFGAYYEWLGVGAVWYFVVLDGHITPVHRTTHANTQTVVYMSTPNLPMRYEITNDGTGGAASITHICCTVVSEGGATDTGFLRYASRGTVPLVTDNSATIFPMLALRLGANYLGTTVKLLDLTLVCASTATYEWMLLLNPTVTGTALSFTPVASSGLEADLAATNATSLTGGVLLDGGYGQSTTDAVQVSLPATDFRIGANIANTADILVLAVRRLVGNAETFYSSLSWREQL